jgi:hypothetical protein
MRSVLPLALPFFAISLLALAAWLTPNVASGGGSQLLIFVTTTDATEVNDSLCSLPEAIKAANTNTNYFGCAGAGGSTDDIIAFSLTGEFPRIDVTTELPTITEGVSILGENLTVGTEMVELRGPGGAQVSGDHGLTIAAPNVNIANLVINSFRDGGVVVEADNFLLVESYIGTNAEGTAALPNASVGVQVKAHNARIGWENCGGICNLISGNSGEGILVDPSATGTRIQGNYIGTDITGAMKLLPDSLQPGIWVKGSGTIIGGDTADPTDGCRGVCNLISGNRFGIRITSTASGTSIDGNVIGLDSDGENSLQSTIVGSGISDDAEHTIIGQVEGNTISGFNVGVAVSGTNTFFHRNKVGTDIEGLVAVPNGLGFWAETANTLLITEDNVISGNLGAGVYVSGSTGVHIEGNRIGASADGSPLPNDIGISIFNSAMNTVSNPANPNEIAYNAADGILVFGAAATGNLITGNSIHDNGGLGISNDAGGNAELPPPVIENADADGANGTVCPNCVIEIFSDNGDEGRTYEGMTTPTAAGVWTFVGELDGPSITATAWDVSTFNTSEFSIPFVIFEPTPSPSPSPSSSPSPTPTGAPQRIQGDVNCDSVVDEDDFELLLSYAAELDDGVQPPPCIDLGATAFGFPWGDVNCDGNVNALDALFVLAYAAGVPLPTPGSCTPLGDTFT